MTRSNAREVAVHMIYELGFGSRSAEELLEHEMTRERFAQLGEEEEPWATPRWNAVSNLIRGTRRRWKNCGPPAAGRDRLQGSGLPRLAAERGGVRRARTSLTGTLLGCGVACPPRRNWKSCWIASTGWLCARLSLGFPVSRLIAVDMMEDGEIEER